MSRNLPEIDNDMQFINIICEHIIHLQDKLVKIDKEDSGDDAVMSGTLLLMARVRQDKGSWEGVSKESTKLMFEVLDIVQTSKQQKS